MLPLACFLALLVIPVPLLGQDQGDPPVGKRYALLVGASRYNASRLRPLPFTEHDVIALAEVLRGRGYHPQDVILLTEGAARGTRVIDLHWPTFARNWRCCTSDAVPRTWSW